MGKGKLYEYNGKHYTQLEYAKLIHKKTGVLVSTITGRIRKGWSAEKIMLPDCVKKPIYQYDLDGNFIKSYTSITKAVLELRKNGINANKGSIRESCMNDGRTSGEYIWRYADDIKDSKKKLNTFKIKSRNGDKDIFYLRRKYQRILDDCYKPNGKYFGNEKIRLWEEWVNNFEKFYNDLIPLYEKARNLIKKYNRRIKVGRLKNAPDKLNCNHIWFTRIDKTEGFLPFNICFTTPNWTMRYKPNSRRVNLDGKIVFIPQIYDIMKSHDNDCVSENSIRQHIIKKENIVYRRRDKIFEYENKYYSSVELGKMFNVPSHRIKYYVYKGYTVKESITMAKNYTPKSKGKV